MSSTVEEGRVHPHRRALRSGAAAAVGTTVEWYDFYIYATAAAIVFPTVFFPEADRAAGSLASFATFAVAFFARPLGAIVFGHIGDRVGRKPALTITLLLMGVATVLVGLVPDYDTIGLWAAVLLIVLRVAQGLAVGGEWGGASLIAVESAPPKWKTFYGGFTQLGNPLGALLATGSFWIIAMQGDDVLLTWGWRVPFLASVILIGVGLYVRWKVEETPVFEQKVEERQQSTPLVFALKNNWYPILLGIGMVGIASGGYYLATTYVQNYATSPDVGLLAEVILGAMTVASFVEALATLPLALLGDTWGRKRIMYLGIGLSVLVFIPLILAIQNQDVAMIYLLVSAVRLTMSATWAPLSALMSQMFRPQARYTSMSLAYGTGAAIWGGLSPVVAAGLFAATGNIWTVVALFVFLGVVAWVSTYLAPQHSDEAPVTGSLEPRLDTTTVRTAEASARTEGDRARTRREP